MIPGEIKTDSGDRELNVGRPRIKIKAVSYTHLTLPTNREV